MLTEKIRNRLISGAFWNSLATIASRGFNLLAGIVIARILGAELYGEVGIIQNSITMFQVLASFSIGLTCSKYVAELKNIEPDNAGGIIGFSLIFSLFSGIFIGFIFFLLSPFLSGDVLNRPDIVNLLKISSVLLVLGAWNGVQMGTLSGLEAFRSQSFANFFSGIITFLCIVLGAYAWKTKGVVIGMIAGLFVQCILNVYIAKKHLIKYKIRIDFKKFKENMHLLYSFSLPAMMGGLIHWVSVWTGNAMLVNQGDGYAQMGIYNACYQWFAIILFFPSIITNATLPVMAERKGAQDFSSIKNVLRVSVKYSFIVLLPLCVIFSLFSKYIMSLYGPMFMNHWPVFVMIMASALFACIQNMVGNTFAVVDKMWIHFNLNVLWCVIYVSIAYFLLHNGLGAMALALAGCVAYVVRLIAMTFFSLKVLKFL